MCPNVRFTTVVAAALLSAAAAAALAFLLVALGMGARTVIDASWRPISTALVVYSRSPSAGALSRSSDDSVECELPWRFGLESLSDDVDAVPAPPPPPTLKAELPAVLSHPFTL